MVAVITKDRSIDIIREFYPGDNVYTLYSDYNNFDLLEKAKIRDASVVFINLNDDTENWYISSTSRSTSKTSTTS